MNTAETVLAEGLNELDQTGTIAPPATGVVTDAITGEPVPELSDPAAPATTDAPVEALAHAMTMVGQQFAAANKHERQHENPDEPVFDGPFDSQRAIDEIFRLHRAVSETAKDLDYARKQQKKASDAYNATVTKLTDRIKQFEAWERGEDGQQPRLRTLSEAERNAETIDQRRARLVEQLKTKSFYVTADELSTLDRTQLDTLEHWLTAGEGVILPDLMTKAHIADAEGKCANCAIVLSLDGAYPELALVGLDCKATNATTTTSARRSRKKKSNAAPPEAERASQIQDAAQRTDEASE